MNAHALLTSQGWRGTGHSLHPTSDSTGLSRPLLVSSKNNNLGIGKKQHKTSDMWWMNAFDKSLKGLDTSVEGQVKQTVTSGGLDMVVKGGARFVGNTGGLYASFVKGDVLGGTLPETIALEEFAVKAVGKTAVASVRGLKNKRKLGDVEGESKEGRRARKAAKRAGRSQVEEPSPKEEVDEESLRKTETKEERRLRRSSKRAKKARKALSKIRQLEESETSELREEMRARKVAKRAKKAQQALKEHSTVDEADKRYISNSETKEQRRERRQRKMQLAKAAKGKEEIIPKKYKEQ